VVKDKVMAQVELQAGPFRVVALISREAADDMGLLPGKIASAVVKSTNVSIQL
jgi:molybdopterin-binding protein